MSNSFDLTVNALREKGLTSDQILKELSDLFQLVANMEGQYVTKSTEEAKIRTMLNLLGMPVNIDGYTHWVYAIDIYSKRKKRLKMQDIYAQVAERYGTTPQRVERTMRSAVKSAFANCENEQIKEAFAGCISSRTGLPKNRHFIVVMSDRI